MTYPAKQKAYRTQKSFTDRTSGKNEISERGKKSYATALQRDSRMRFVGLFFGLYGCIYVRIPKVGTCYFFLSPLPLVR
jgi:hypothetical protein